MVLLDERKRVCLTKKHEKKAKDGSAVPEILAIGENSQVNK